MTEDRSLLCSHQKSGDVSLQTALNISEVEHGEHGCPSRGFTSGAALLIPWLRLLHAIHLLSILIHYGEISISLALINTTKPP